MVAASRACGTVQPPPRCAACHGCLQDRVALLRALDAQLDMTPCGRDGDLSRCLMAGIAFHHGGASSGMRQPLSALQFSSHYTLTSAGGADLTMEEREVVEQGMRSGALAVLVATTTLAAGVNLPAQRVSINSVRPPARTITPVGAIMDRLCCPAVAAPVHTFAGHLRRHRGV